MRHARENKVNTNCWNPDKYMNETDQCSPNELFEKPFFWLTFDIETVEASIFQDVDGVKHLCLNII